MTTENKPLFVLTLENIQMSKPIKAKLVAYDQAKKEVKISFNEMTMVTILENDTPELLEKIGSALIVNPDGVVFLAGKKVLQEKTSGRSGASSRDQASVFAGL